MNDDARHIKRHMKGGDVVMHESADKVKQQRLDANKKLQRDRIAWAATVDPGALIDWSLTKMSKLTLPKHP
jgi:hypothetical protein